MIIPSCGILYVPAAEYVNISVILERQSWPIKIHSGFVGDLGVTVLSGSLFPDIFS